jgi:hypothetical protein
MEAVWQYAAYAPPHTGKPVLGLEFDLHRRNGLIHEDVLGGRTIWIIGGWVLVTGLLVDVGIGGRI